MRPVFNALVFILLSIVAINTAYGSNPTNQSAQLTVNQNKTSSCSDDWFRFTLGKVVPLTSRALRFATCLRNAINTDNRKWVAGHVFYPIKITIGDQIKLIHNENEFLKFYDEIVDDHIKQIAASNSLWTLSKLDDGFMIDTGQIWIMALGPPEDKNPKAKFYVVTVQ